MFEQNRTTEKMKINGWRLMLTNECNDNTYGRFIIEVYSWIAMFFCMAKVVTFLDVFLYTKTWARLLALFKNVF